MALSDTKLRNLKPGEKPYIETDEGGLHIEVMPGGAKVWRLRYRVGGRGSKQEKISLGDYPAYSLADARTWRDDCKVLAGRGLSPMALKRGDPIPDDAAPVAKELAQLFIREWCLKAIEKAKKILAAIKEAEKKGSGVIAVNGKMVDRPVVIRAQRVIDLALASGVIKQEDIA